MKTKLIILTVAFFVSMAQELFAWGSTEHEAITFIAECNLNPKAKKRIESYLGGHSIVYYATWMDGVRKMPEYSFSDTWHMGVVDENFKCVEERCIPELEKIIEKLENYKTLDDSTLAVNLKFLIHLVADMHCPSHVIYTNLLTSFNVIYIGEDRSYHSVWDDAMMRHAHAWSYTEYQHQLDRCSVKEKKQIMQGNPREWFEQSAKDCIIIYEWAKPGDKLDFNFIYRAHTLGENQMVKAGYRLAYLLNKLFG